MLKNIKDDLGASVVVFFVALPLCLGIALASGAPLFSGIIAGIVGGIVVGFASGSALGVSGPAAGLAVIVLSAITTLGSWPAFLLAVVLAGCIQLLMGFARVGFIAHFFPSSVIKGMLTGIGLLIILKQIPHALGYDKDFIGDFSFFQHDGETTLSSLLKMFNVFSIGALIISSLSIAVLILWDVFLSKKNRLFELLQGPVVVVLLGVLINTIFSHYETRLYLGEGHLVSLPVAKNITEFFQLFSFPSFAQLINASVWKTAIIIALVASLETLLCVEATDKLDPYKRVTPTNRELKAQGIGNIISGLIGGLPITQVIIRSSANISFGGKSKMSTILHGLFLLISAITITRWMNMIPLASLAAILIVVGYKLANPVLFQKMFKLGLDQFIPFISTVIGILATDLLTGISIGIGFGIFYTLKKSYNNAYYMQKTICKENNHLIYQITLAEEVSFFHKASFIHLLDKIPLNSKVIIDCSRSKSIAYDVVEFIKDFKNNASNKNLVVETINFL